MKEKINLCIWFSSDNGSIENILTYYETIFKSNFNAGPIVSLGDTPSGHSEMCDITLFGQRYTFLNTAEAHHPLNDAMSLVISCDDQVEIDQYWDYFTTEGEPFQCGWCMDKYGLRWQVIPYNINELLMRPNANDVLMNQVKIIISEY